MNPVGSLIHRLVAFSEEGLGVRLWITQNEGDYLGDGFHSSVPQICSGAFVDISPILLNQNKYGYNNPYL